MNTQKRQVMTVLEVSSGAIIGKAELIDGLKLVYLELKGLISARLRMDGYWGFQSAGGHYTLMCSAEQGKIGANKPKPAVVREILAEINQNPPSYETHNGWTFVDGFAYKLEPTP